MKNHGSEEAANRKQQVRLAQKQAPSLPLKTRGAISCHDNRQKSMLRRQRRRVEQTVELQGDVKNSSRAADGRSVLLMPPKMASAGDAAATFDPSILQQEHE